VSTGAALSMQAMSEDFASMFEGSEAFKQSAAEISEIKNWEPAHLYVFTRGTPKYLTNSIPYKKTVNAR